MKQTQQDLVATKQKFIGDTGWPTSDSVHSPFFMMIIIACFG